jgi:cyclin H
MLKEVDASSEPSLTERKELKALAKKLNKCRNPEKMDLVGLHRAKREGEEGVDEKIVKKRKLEREQSAKEGEDLFGPAIKKT